MDHIFGYIPDENTRLNNLHSNGVNVNLPYLTISFIIILRPLALEFLRDLIAFSISFSVMTKSNSLNINSFSFSTSLFIKSSSP
jgi:hypothetical protein